MAAALHDQKNDLRDKKNDPPDDKNKTGRLSRRAFLKSAGAAAAVVGLIGVAPDDSPASDADSASAAVDGPSGAQLGELLGPGAVTIALNVNGKQRTLAIEPRVTLLSALRDRLGLTLRRRNGSSAQARRAESLRARQRGRSKDFRLGQYRRRFRAGRRHP